jgi:putative ABC transport system permease protein
VSATSTIATADGAREKRRLPLVWRLALREMRSGLGGFYVFVACVALGVAVITAVGALGDALRSGFEQQGARILGGDLTLSRMHQRATAPERTVIDGLGAVSETATMRAMARTVGAAEQSLVELKAVDVAYPLVGEMQLRNGGRLDQSLVGAAAVVDPLLLERLRLKVGDEFELGTARVRIAAVKAAEPDTISDRATYGPRVMVSLATLERTGLVQPGTLVRWRYALRLPKTSIEHLDRLKATLRKDLSEGGFLVADRRDPSPQITRAIDRLRQFLTLVGLTALLVGGVGVANAVATFIDRRRTAIAVYKTVGATGSTVLAIYLVQVILIALIGISIGLVVGYAVPVALDQFLGDALPIRAVLTLSPGTIAAAAGYGILVALLFTLWPLGQTETMRPALLFRDELAAEQGWPSRRLQIAIAVLTVGLVAFAILSSESRTISLYFTAAVVVVLGVFLGLGHVTTLAARRLRRPARAEAALAIANIGAPGGLTRSIMLSLGAGLSLLVAVALAETSMRAELTTRLPAEGPSYFVLDIPRGEHDHFSAVVAASAPGSRVEDAPMLRGRIVRLNGVAAEDVKTTAEAQWVLNGDRGLTYSEEVPKGSTVVEGTWWRPGYAGEPLVSFEVDLARRLGLKIGDTVTVNVLGRNVTARISNLREVRWESLAINFVMVFSPNTLRSAPYNLLATVTLPPSAGLNAEAHLGRAVAHELPSVTAIRVRDALAAFQTIYTRVVTAVQVAGSVTLAAGALVLAGALATAQRRRIKQAVILRTLGATSRRILWSHMLEYLALGLVTAAASIVLGTAASYIAVTQVMEFDFVFSWQAVAVSVALSLGLVAVFGSIGTWQALRARPVPYLRGI